MSKSFGIGIDIVDIEQFKKIPLNTKPNFYKKIFLDSEIKYCLKYKNPYEHFAGKFAIKEAVKKAIPDKISFLDIETYHLKSKPMVRLKGRLARKHVLRVSISHEKKLAVGVVISQSNQ